MKHALSKKLPFYFLGTILAPYDPEVLVWVIWHHHHQQQQQQLEHNNSNLYCVIYGPGLLGGKV